jgi:hypothetical protein
VSVEPILAAVRLQHRRSQQATDVAGGDRCDNFSQDGFIGDFPRGPKLDGSLGESWGFAGDGEDVCDLFRRKLMRCPSSWWVCEDGFNGTSEFGCGCVAFNGDECVPRLLPSSSPLPDMGSTEIDLFGDIRIEFTLEREQDNFGPLNEPSFRSFAFAMRCRMACCFSEITTLAALPDIVFIHDHKPNCQCNPDYA